MRDGLRRQEVWLFLGLIVVVNALFVASIYVDVLPNKAYNLGRFVLLGLSLIGVVTVFQGPKGLLGLIRPMGVWRVSPLWYLLVLIWAPMVCILVLAGKSLLTGTNAFALHFEVLSRPALIRTILIGSFIGEIVWVSYAIRALALRFGVLGGSVIVGVFWTLWWTPIVLLGVGVIPDLPILALLVNMVGVAAMCGLVYAFTKSGIVVLLLQIMVNSSVLVFPVAPTSGGIPTYWGFSAVYLMATLLLYLVMRPRAVAVV